MVAKRKVQTCREQLGLPLGERCACVARYAPPGSNGLGALLIRWCPAARPVRMRASIRAAISGDAERALLLVVRWKTDLIFERGGSPTGYDRQMPFFRSAQTRAFRRARRYRSARPARNVQTVLDWRMPEYPQTCRGLGTSDRFPRELPWQDRSRLFSPAPFCCW